MLSCLSGFFNCKICACMEKWFGRVPTLAETCYNILTCASLSVYKNPDLWKIRWQAASHVQKIPHELVAHVAKVLKSVIWCWRLLATDFVKMGFIIFKVPLLSPYSLCKLDLQTAFNPMARDTIISLYYKGLNDIGSDDRVATYFHSSSFTRFTLDLRAFTSKP